MNPLTGIMTEVMNMTVVILQSLQRNSLTMLLTTAVLESLCSLVKARAPSTGSRPVGIQKTNFVVSYV